MPAERELCDDRYDPGACERYARGDLAPPRECPLRLEVVRGGAWGLPWWNCKVSTRNTPWALAARCGHVGSRVVLPEPEAR